MSKITFPLKKKNFVEVVKNTYSTHTNDKS